MRCTGVNLKIRSVSQGKDWKGRKEKRDKSDDSDRCVEAFLEDTWACRKRNEVVDGKLAVEQEHCLMCRDLYSFCFS
jgi:hypothetical protein